MNSGHFAALEGLEALELEAESFARPHTARVKQPLVWIDLEMTGLDVDTDTIVEIACVVSSGDLAQVYEGPNIAVHHSDDVLSNMNEWSMVHHAESGLTARCKASRVSMQDAEGEVLAFVKRHCIPCKAPLAGNCVHMDKAFIRKYMPRLHEFLHFRIVDVSSIHELCMRWCPRQLRHRPAKLKEHTAMADILESLEELRWYKTALFKLKHRQEVVTHPYEQDGAP